MAGRTTTPALQSLGERISVSQRDEILMMQQWLRDHHETVPDPLSHQHMAMEHGRSPDAHARHAHGRADDATGRGARTEFDQLFLTGMIQHHAGARWRW